MATEISWEQAKELEKEEKQEEKQLQASKEEPGAAAAPEQAEQAEEKPSPDSDGKEAAAAEPKPAERPQAPGASEPELENDADDIHPLFLEVQKKKPAPAPAPAAENAEQGKKVLVHGYPDGDPPTWEVKPPRRGIFVRASSFQKPLKQQIKLVRKELERTVFADVFDTPEELLFKSGTAAPEDSEETAEEKAEAEAQAAAEAEEDAAEASATDEEEPEVEPEERKADPAASPDVPESLDPALPFKDGNRRGRYRVRHVSDAVPVYLEYFQLLLQFPPETLKAEFDRHAQKHPASPGSEESPEHPRRPPKLQGLGPEAVEALLVSFLRAAVNLLPKFTQQFLTGVHKLLQKRRTRAAKSLQQKQREEQRQKKLAEQAAAASAAAAAGGDSEEAAEAAASPKAATPAAAAAEEAVVDPQDPEALVLTFGAFAYDLQDPVDLELAGLALRRFKRDIPRFRTYVEKSLVDMQRRTPVLARQFFQSLDAGKDARVTRPEFLQRWGPSVLELLVTGLQFEKLFPLHCFRERGDEKKIVLAQDTSAEVSPLMLYLPFVDPRSQKYRRQQPGFDRR